MTDDFESIIHEKLEEIFGLLEKKTKEERLKYFKQAYLEDFLMECGDTTYIVRTHYSDKAAESLQEKVERFISK